MAESELSHTFMKHLNKVGHAIRVENVEGSGTPDINYAFERAQGWVETKEAKAGYLYFERFQIPWFRRRLRATGGHSVWVLAKVGLAVNLYHPSIILAAEREPYKKWVRVKVTDIQPRYSDYGKVTDWSAIIDILADDRQVYKSN